MQRAILVCALVGMLSPTIASCTSAASSAGDGKIALLLPDVKTARYETFDRPLFTARVEQLGDFDVLYS
ncbi:hypothetical protein WB334_26535, partial [Escherichia coli]|uniref:hypothetical protein n=1 Tax=Escherichia coli TaxID=562 RepID=UPI0021571207